MDDDALTLVTAALAAVDALKERVERKDDRALAGAVGTAVDSLHELRRALEGGTGCVACGGPCVADVEHTHFLSALSISSTVRSDRTL